MKQQRFFLIKVRPKKDNLLGNRNGQAMIEYILMLIVTVSLLFLASKVFESMNKFMNNYIGDYIACLMEYGELPTMGVAEADLKNHLSGSISGCDTKFEGFTLSNGKPAKGGEGGSGGKSSGGKSEAASSGGKGSAKKEGSGSSSGSDNFSSDTGRSGGGRGSSSKSSSNSNPYNNGQIRRSGGGGTADSASTDEKVRVVEEEGEGVEEGRGRNRYGRTRETKFVYKKDKYRAITGRLAEEIEKKTPKRTERKPTTTSFVKVENDYMFTPKKKAFMPPVEIKDVKIKDEGDDGSFQFGYFIKWLLIAGMILAIVILLGGQILNYSNSGDQ